MASDKQISVFPAAPSVKTTMLLVVVDLTNPVATQTEQATVAQLATAIAPAPQVFFGVAAPPVGLQPGQDATKAALYYPSSGGVTYQWNGAAWQ